MCIQGYSQTYMLHDVPLTSCLRTKIIEGETWDVFRDVYRYIFELTLLKEFTKKCFAISFTREVNAMEK